MRKSFFAFLLMVFGLLAAFPAVAKALTIRSIEFDGNVRTAASTIKDTIASRVESALNPEIIRRDIKALYKLGQFRDIRVETTHKADGVHLFFHFVENPVIADVRFEGNRKIKSNDLKGKISIKTYRPLDEHDVAASMEKIRTAYAEKGYYLAQVDYHVETTEKGETKLVFDIIEHQGVFVRRVLFMGNKAFSDDELRKVIKTKQKGPFSFVTSSGKYQEEELQIDTMRLTVHYLNNGYLKAKVTPPKTTISKDKRYIFITFQLHEGKQYRIDKIDVAGDILTTREELTSLLTTKKGDLYSHRKLEQDIKTLSERYGDQGYAFANIVPETLPDDEKLTADVTLRIEKGKRITIERINIIGNTTTRDKVIRRELRIVEQDRYSERNLEESRKRLMQLGFFEEVNFATPRGSRDDTVLLNVTVKERPTGSFNIGAGFSSIENFIFNASVQKQNFLGYGIGGELAMELSERRQFFSFSVNDPYFLDTQYSAGMSIYRNAYLYNDFRRTALGGSLNVGHRFFTHWSADVGYQIEDVNISSFSVAVPQLFRLNASGLTSAMSLTLAHDTRDNRLFPRRGTFNTVTNEISGSKLGGDNDFFRVNYRTVYYQPIWKGILFKTFGRIGHIKSLNERSVPLFERFFAGGPNSLRGYFPNSLGPRIRIPSSASGPDIDFVYGGDKLLLFVAELELPIYEPAGIRTVAFFDAGNAYAEGENFSLGNMRTDYGFGLRWNSPMGPLRFEWGIPLSRKSGEDPVVFNFTIGNFF